MCYDNPYGRTNRNVMKLKKLITSFLSLVLFATIGLAQATYSESFEYKPRDAGKPKKESKKKSDGTDTRQSASADGEVTITLPVAVVDGAGMAVTGLLEKDFSVFVDNLSVPIAGFDQNKQMPVVVLVLDTSRSTTERFKDMQGQATRIVNAFPIGTRIMVVDFNTELKVRSQPTENRSEAVAAISKIKMGTGTSIYDATYSLFENVLPTVPGRKIVVLITDGVDTTSQKTTYAKALTEVEKNDVTVYPIYLNTNDDNAKARDAILQILRNSNVALQGSLEDDYMRGLLYLQDLARASGGRNFSNEKLDEGIRSLLTELGNRYYLTITVPRKNSISQPVRVRVHRPSLSVLARGSVVAK